jgi:DnaK suppressor protein
MSIRQTSRRRSETRALRDALQTQQRRFQAAARAAKQTIQDDRLADTGLVADVAERSEADVREDVDLALFAIRNEMLADTNRALIQVGAGRYGRCEECGARIGPDRLEALPWATRCGPCEEIREARTDRDSAARTRRLARGLAALRRLRRGRPVRV